MKLVSRTEILDLAAYEQVREHFRARVIEEKKHRRVLVGPNVSVLFENHDTVLLQIQEMLRTERITREAAVLHEIETYNGLLGGPRELGATVMIQIADPAERDAFLVAARGIERHIVLVVGGDEMRATWDESRVLPEQASAVTYVKLSLPETACAALKSGKAPLALKVDHPAVAASTELAPDVRASLAEDFVE
jgi:Protein of unknown function (DUF3501)